MLNIIIVFVLSGIWHGASWTFIIWGGLFAIVYLIEKVFNYFLKIKIESEDFSWMHLLSALKTFIIVTIIWVFFRSIDFNSALTMFKSAIYNWNVENISLDIPWKTPILLIFFISTDLAFYNTRFDKWISKKPLAIRWTAYSFLVFSIIVFAGIENFPFIYFQF
ncbi:MAG: hypothetical protein AB8B74_08990 [Crocinitomicaceae bacterium]